MVNKYMQVATLPTLVRLEVVPNPSAKNLRPSILPLTVDSQRLVSQILERRVEHIAVSKLHFVVLEYLPACNL